MLLKVVQKTSAVLKPSFSFEIHKNINIFITFSSLLFPPNVSNLTFIGSFLLALGMGGVGGVGVGVTKFCNSLLGGGSWCCCATTPSDVFVGTISFWNIFCWLGCMIVWTGDLSVWLWCNWWDFNRCAKVKKQSVCWTFNIHSV